MAKYAIETLKWDARRIVDIFLSSGDAKGVFWGDLKSEKLEHERMATMRVSEDCNCTVDPFKGDLFCGCKSSCKSGVCEGMDRGSGFFLLSSCSGKCIPEVKAPIEECDSKG